MGYSLLNTKTIVAILGVAGASSAFGYWGYAELKAHQLREEIVSMVRDTSERMRVALTTPLPPAAVDNPAMLRRLYDDAETVDAYFRRMQREDLAPLPELASAADDYLLTSREILLRWASSQRCRLKLSASIRALENHMRADDRTAAWVTEAIRAKERVEEDYRDYARTMNALNMLLDSFPAARDKMIAKVDPALITNPHLVTAVRTDVAAAAIRATEEMERIRQLRTYR
ncbi:MAG: hypothetical protein ACT4P8_07040 [Betaproteobacteria bacterium]